MVNEDVIFAIECLEDECKNMDLQCDIGVNDCFIKTAVEARKKRIPMPVRSLDDGFCRFDYKEYCPSCGYDFDRSAPNFCPECGQAIFEWW